VNILLKGISCWQREQFLFTAQKSMVSQRKVLKISKMRTNMFPSFVVGSFELTGLAW